MRTREILMDLIGHLDEFEGASPGAEKLTLSDFVAFLNRKVSLPFQDTHIRDGVGDKAPWLIEMGNETETLISRLVAVMNRYAKSYIKRALAGSPIQTAEEFSFMLYLLTFDSLTKTELIYKNLMEKTSGMEVIKRLHRLGMVREFDDAEDKRSKRISLTPYGMQEIIKVLPTMRRVSFLISGNLTPAERETLVFLLRKLDQYHHDIFVEDRHSDFDRLAAKYLAGDGKPDMDVPPFPDAGRS